jgi:hypothetical protein
MILFYVYIYLYIHLFFKGQGHIPLNFTVKSFILYTYTYIRVYTLQDGFEQAEISPAKEDIMAESTQEETAPRDSEELQD